MYEHILYTYLPTLIVTPLIISCGGHLLEVKTNFQLTIVEYHNKCILCENTVLHFFK